MMVNGYCKKQTIHKMKVRFTKHKKRKWLVESWSEKYQAVVTLLEGLGTKLNLLKS